MEIREKRINGKVYRFVNESWSRSNAWGHRSVLLVNGRELEESKVRYYNRTWEYYQFQTSMYKVLENYKSRMLNDFISMYKSNNNVVKFRRGEKEKVIALFNESELGKDIQILEDSIRDRKFN